MTRPILPGAVAHRQQEIEASLQLSRYHSAYRPRLYAAVDARLPLPGDPAVADIARCAALAELTVLAARGVLALGPGDGPRPVAAKAHPRVPSPCKPMRKPALLVSFGDDASQPMGEKP